MTNLSAPFDTSPYTEIDKYPHHQQTDSQLRHNTPTIFYGIRDLDHMVSYFKKKIKNYIILLGILRLFDGFYRSLNALFPWCTIINYKDDI